MNALSPTIYAKVIGFNSSNELWDILQNIYEGNDNVKNINLPLYGEKFENIEMKETENIAAYLLRVDEVSNTIIGFEEELKESMII